jgi:nucleotide-binding universal stress UspA family protein
MEKIVVGFDGSDEAKRALDRAATLGKGGASVTVVAAVEVESHAYRSMGRVDQDELSSRRELIDAAKARLKEDGIEAHAVEGEGHAADVIIEAAKQQGADLIVVGTRGRNAAKRVLAGSVSTKLVHDAPCDVLVVR